MSGAMVNLYSEYNELLLECEADCPVIWIRAYNGPSVSLDLSRADRSNLRAALDAADKIAGLLESDK